MLTGTRTKIGAVALAALFVAAACSSAATTAPTAAPTTPTAAPATAAPATQAPAASAAASMAAVTPPTVPTGNVSLQGAGATFPAPLYNKWFTEFSKVNPNIKIDYTANGSGAGIKAITEQTVDFGASDAPMKDTEIAALPKGMTILHLPTTLGAVAVIYNLPGVSPLKLDGDTLSKIYLGTIKKWNDPAIVALNSGVTLPSTDIVVVHRSDGSGTSNAYTTYLSAVSADWKSKVGAGKAVNWPIGVGAKGNDGVAGQVKQLPGAVGYVDLSVALTSNIPTAEMKNAAGEYIAPSTAAVTTAANTAVANWPADSRQGPIVNANAPGAYPIATFTYLLYYTTQTDLAKAQAFISFYYWAQTDGVQYEEALGYAPIPDSVKAVAFDSLHTVTVNGTVVWPK